MDNTIEFSQSSASEEFYRLSRLVVELEGKFREQRSQLQKRGMSLPPGTLGGLQQIRMELESLASQSSENQNELLQLRALSNTTELVNSALELDDVLNGVMDTVISLTKAERGYLMLRNLETQILEFRVARNKEQRNLSKEEFIISSTVVQQVGQTGLPLISVDAQADDRLKDGDSVIMNDLRSILCVPLLLKGRVTGVFYADNSVKLGLFGDTERQALEAFANQAAVAIENARLFDDVRRNLAEITALRDLLENVFASIASGVLTTNAIDRITQVNDAACRILNLSLEQTLNRLWWEALPPLHERLNEMLHVVRTFNMEQSVEVEKEIENRGLTYLNLKLSPLRDSAQTTDSVAIVVDDVTELKQREFQLKVVRRYLTPAMVDNIHTIDKLGLGGERRLVTVIYVDVRGFNTFPHKLNPQDFMKLLNNLLTIASDAISVQNGVIDKYMANEVMGLFNTQLNPMEDHAARAVQAAFNMAASYRDFYNQIGEPEGTVHFRVGINTGEATLGNVGSEARREFTAIGDTINLGHRLLENANPGQIVVSERTALACESFGQPLPDIHVLGSEEISVKGRRETTKIYRVHGK